MNAAMMRAEASADVNFTSANLGGTATATALAPSLSLQQSLAGLREVLALVEKHHTSKGTLTGGPGLVNENAALRARVTQLEAQLGGAPNKLELVQAAGDASVAQRSPPSPDVASKPLKLQLHMEVATVRATPAARRPASPRVTSPRQELTVQIHDVKASQNVEKRVDPYDKGLYTKEQFIGKYKGTGEWDAAPTPAEVADRLVQEVGGVLSTGVQGRTWRDGPQAPVSFEEAFVGQTIIMIPHGRAKPYAGKVKNKTETTITMQWKPPEDDPYRKLLGGLSGPPKEGTEDWPSVQEKNVEHRVRDETKQWWERGGNPRKLVQKLKPHEYIEELQCQRDEVNADQLTEMRGRLCYGSSSAAFRTLGNPAVKSCFLMGGDGLKLLLTCGADPQADSVDLLLKIGYDVLTIYNNVRWGSVTALVVFPADSIANQPATWMGAGKILAEKELYTHAGRIIQRHAAELRISGAEPFNFRDYQELEKEYREGKPKNGEYAKTTPLTQAGKKNRDYGEGENRGKKYRFEHDDFRFGAKMTEEALVELDKEGRARPCHSRAFLLHFVGMNSLFGGDGLALAEGNVRSFYNDTAEESAIWQQIRSNLRWPPGQGPSGPWPPEVTRDIYDPAQNKVRVFAGDRLVRCSRKGDSQGTVSPVHLPQDVPDEAEWVVLVSKDCLQEYIAPNMLAKDIKGMVISPVGSPKLEQCVKKMAELIESVLESIYKVKKKSYVTQHNWVPMEIMRQEEERGGAVKIDGRVMNPATGCLDDGRDVFLTPEEFAVRYCKDVKHADAVQDADGVVKAGERLTGVGFRIRCCSTPQQTALVAAFGGLERGLKVSGPATLQNLPRNCLDALLYDGFKPFQIYDFLLSFGMGFTLEIMPWDLWKEGDSPQDRRHFPTSKQGIAAFIQRWFPEASAAYERHKEEICSSPPSADDIQRMTTPKQGDPKKMTYEEFRKRNDVATVTDVRQFLKDTLSLGVDWQGNTASHGLDPCDRSYQYLMRNEELTKMRQEGRIITIPLGCPSPDSVVEKLQKKYKAMREGAD